MTRSLPQQNKDITSDLSASVLEKIERGEVMQVPRWQFLLTEYGIWALWAASVLIGAIAFSVILFFGMNAGLAFYEATHDDALRFFLEMIPYAWVIVFILMALLAHYNLRHTKRGYKYKVWQVLFSSILFSFLGGLVLHGVGMGFVVDNFVAKRLPILPAFQNIEAQMWQSPMQGRMIGKYGGEGAKENIALFTDIQGDTWNLDTSELNELDLKNLRTLQQVRVIGLLATSTPAYFHGCGVFPWAPEKNASFGDLREEREYFIERMRAHQKSVFKDKRATGTVEKFLPASLCASHAAVIRIRR